MEIRQWMGPSHTLLLVMPTLVARIDFIGRRKPLLSRLWHQSLSSPPQNGSTAASQFWLTSAVSQGLKLGPKRLGKVSIVCPILFTDIYQLANEVVSLATACEIQQALALEAEIESRISPFDCMVACQPLEGDDRGVAFLFTLISRTLVAELRKLVHSRRSKLVKLSHPIALEQTGESPGSPSLPEALRIWNGRDSGDGRNWVATDPSRPPSEVHDSPQKFLEEFAERWGRHLAIPASRMPLVFDLQAGSRSARDLALSCIMAAATLSGIAGWHSSSQAARVSVSQSIQQLEQQQNHHNEVLAETQKLETQLVRLRKQTQATEETRRTLERKLHLADVVARRNNARWSHLLDSMADASGDCWIQRIESTGRVTKLVGIAPSIAQAHTFAAKLASTLQGKGWAVAPANTRLLPSALIEFSIAMTQDFDARDVSEDGREIVSHPVGEDRRSLQFETGLGDSQS